MPGTTLYEPYSLLNVVPFYKHKPAKCSRYKYIGSTYGTNECLRSDFNQSAIIQCDEFVYQTDEVTILNEVNIQINQKKFTFFKKKKKMF